MKRTDAGSVGAGIYQSVFIDEVDVMTTDVVDGVYDLCGKLLSYMRNDENAASFECIRCTRIAATALGISPDSM